MAGKYLVSLMVILGLAYGCTTTRGAQSPIGRLDDHQARIERLESRQTAGPQASGDVQKRLSFLEGEVKAVRRAFADSQASIDSLLERVESLEAIIKESDLNVSRLRKRGVDVDRALEDLANKLEAEVRTLAEKMKEMMEQ
jgi:chromosome segregation ATPase